MRLILLLHRYLGVAMGVIMTVWCLSGFVMMYRGYPQLDEAARLKGLAPVRLAPAAPALPLADTERVAGFHLEMSAGRPVLQLYGEGKGARSIDLDTAAAPPPLTEADVLGMAAAYASANGIGAPPRDLGVIARDQWTVENARRNGPVHHIRLDDPAGDEIYIADRSGVVVQATTRAARLWGWLGAVPHWLYPTILRQNAALWTGVVVWSSIAGCFLTLTGLYVGVTRLRPHNSGRWSPYRGLFYWHHLIGLVFGVLTLTWVTSGLMTMTPWGLLDTPVSEVQHDQLAGGVDGAAIKRFLTAFAHRPPEDVVALSAAPLNGRLFVMAADRSGAARRLDGEANPAPLAEADVAAALRRTQTAQVSSLVRQTTEDAYYYSGYDGAVPLPVYRAQLADGEKTTLYIDRQSGDVLRAIDGQARASRWLRTGLHDWDFGGLRRRPIWDIVVLTLLAGVTGVCGLGAWLGLRRLGRDITAVKQYWSARCRARTPAT